MKYSKKIAVTGARGFIGSNLVQVLLDHGYTVFGSDHPEADSHNACINYADVDLNDYDAIKLWLKHVEPEVIIHLGARTDLLGRSAADYTANTQGVRNIIDAANNTGCVKRVLFASSRMVCRINHIPNSYDDYCPPNLYGESKVIGEQIVKSSFTNFDWVIFRPTSIWGPGFGIPYRNFFDQVRRGSYYHQMGHNPLKSFGFIYNTTFQICKLVEAPAHLVGKQTFYLGDYTPISVMEWANYINECFALPTRVRTLPMPILRLGAVAGDVVNLILRKDASPLTSFRLNNLITNMVYPQLSELEEITGILPYDWRAGTRLTVDWLKNSK